MEKKTKEMGKERKTKMDKERQKWRKKGKKDRQRK